MYVYFRDQTGVYTVGFFDPAGRWMPESYHRFSDDAAERVAWLNGDVAAGLLLPDDAFEICDDEGEVPYVR